MGSKSTETVETSATSVAIDDRAVLESGQQIVDSLMVSNDANVVREALAPTLAAWGQMTTTGSLNLVEVMDLADTLIEQVSKSQVNLGKDATKVLQEGRELFGDLLAQNKLTVNMVEDVTLQALKTSSDTVDILAEVKTADFSDLSKTIMLFALAAMAISGWAITRN